MAKPEQPITIKKYADRLYHPGVGACVTLDDLAAMIEDDEVFVVREAKTGDDLTPSVLRQIILKRGYHG